jgi:hypothetical protein
MPNFIQTTPNLSGLKVDTSELVVGSNTVERQNVCLADPVTAANIANVVTKGSQGTYALATQPLKDSGRTSVCFSIALAPVSTETLVSFGIFKAGNAGTSGTSYTVTAGKTFRLQCVNGWALTSVNAGAALNIRTGPATGMTIANSFILIPLPMVPNTGWLTVNPATVPDGLEVPGGTTLAVSAVGYSGASVYFYATFIGYEY